MGNIAPMRILSWDASLAHAYATGGITAAEYMELITEGDVLWK